MENKAADFKPNFLLKFVTYDLTNEFANLNKNRTTKNFNSFNKSTDRKSKKFEDTKNSSMSITRKHSITNISKISIKEDVNKIIILYSLL